MDKKLHELTKLMIYYEEKIKELPTDVEPPPNLENAVNALREAAHDLAAACSHFLEG